MTFLRKGLFATVAGIGLAAFCLPSAVVPAHAQQNAPASTPSEVLNQIHHINQKEIHFAKTALNNTQDPQVKAFAKRMIQDHSAADKKTEQLAKNEKVKLQKFEPTDEEKVSMDQLKSLKGPEFDSAYMNEMKQGHEQALTYLRTAKQQVSNPAVKDLLAILIPTVQQHEQQASNIAMNLSQSRAQAAGQAGSQQNQNQTQSGY